MNNLFRANSTNIENRGDVSPQKNKFDIKKAKNNVVCSLNEVGYFFNNFSHFIKYVKLYKLLR